MHFGCAVALSGRFGLDLDLDALDEDEWRACSAAAALAKRTRPLVQRGELVRLVSPVDGADRSRAALAYVGDDGDSSVLFAYQLESTDEPGPSLALDWLNTDGSYTVAEIDLASGHEPVVRQVSGRDLCEGIDWPLTEPETARIWEVTRVLG